ncbi:hypothetical protein ABH931_007099 [Streptacidiphilus sp. MAP12-33]|uniref:hypothetical protein n=1 Tax=Streptacidiphilus sp. MAP12-33 TaxID=3156266 RepID=UPI0035158971
MNAKYRLAARRRAESRRRHRRLGHDPELLELLRAAAAIARPRPEPDPSGRRPVPSTSHGAAATRTRPGRPW